ncbi:MAG: stage IV sporulation protein A, partial [Clostridia bacterium]|nr:stage IV sporulation protein A [Clostridia bacterium]
FEITGEQSLISLLRELSETKAAYDKIAEALRDCDERGYGIVMPDVSDMTLDEPEIVRQSGGYGVRLRASASSVHMIKANIEAEVSPIVGTEQQSEDLVRYMLKEFDEDPTKIWESNMFGKSLYELVNEGIHAKLEHMPEASRQKLSETLERIINEGSGGLICILL